MTAGEMKRLLDCIPDDMYVFMYVDEENCIEVCMENSDIEEVMSEVEQPIRVFMLRPSDSTDLIIPKKSNPN